MACVMGAGYLAVEASAANLQAARAEAGDGWGDLINDLLGQVAPDPPPRPDPEGRAPLGPGLPAGDAGAGACPSVASPRQGVSTVPQ
eukprot:7170094-Pyramimonas_sp.AAC.1